MTSPILELRNLRKRFGGGDWVLDGLTLSVDPGELLCVLGPSGCGKSTLLGLICGFDSPDGGEIAYRGAIVSRPGWSLPPERRRIGIVFQDFALFPHLTVRENVSFGLQPTLWRRLRSAPAANQANRSRVEELIELTGLTGLESRYPHELSGGQVQRVALARALAPQPELLLLDEPFSNLDPSLRHRLREDVADVLKQAHTTAIFVTHDQDDAMNLADRIAIMHEKRIEQVGSPEEVLHSPKSRYVASFTGATNFLRGRISGATVETELGNISLENHQLPAGGEASASAARALANGCEVDMLIRPSYLHPDSDGKGVPVTIEHIDYMGVQRLYSVALPSGKQLQAVFPGRMDLQLGDRIKLIFQPPNIVLFPV